MIFLYNKMLNKKWYDTVHVFLKWSFNTHIDEVWKVQTHSGLLFPFAGPILKIYVTVSLPRFWRMQRHLKIIVISKEIDIHTHIHPPTYIKTLGKHYPLLTHSGKNNLKMLILYNNFSSFICSILINITSRF